MSHLPLDGHSRPERHTSHHLIHWDRSPDLIEDQFSTIRASTAHLVAAHVQNGPGYSRFRISYVLCNLLPGRNLSLLGAHTSYWSLSLEASFPRLPDGKDRAFWPMTPPLSVDLSVRCGVRRAKPSLAGSARFVSDWYLSYYLPLVPGVADVCAPSVVYAPAPIPRWNLTRIVLQRYGIPVSPGSGAVRGGNNESSWTIA